MQPLLLQVETFRKFMAVAVGSATTGRRRRASLWGWGTTRATFGTSVQPSECADSTEPDGNAVLARYRATKRSVMSLEAAPQESVVLCAKRTPVS